MHRSNSVWRWHEGEQEEERERKRERAWRKNRSRRRRSQNDLETGLNLARGGGQSTFFGRERKIWNCWSPLPSSLFFFLLFLPPLPVPKVFSQVKKNFFFPTLCALYGNCTSYWNPLLPFMKFEFELGLSLSSFFDGRFGSTDASAAAAAADGPDRNGNEKKGIPNVRMRFTNKGVIWSS